jgi:hypothetical protein
MTYKRTVMKAVKYDLQNSWKECLYSWSPCRLSVSYKWELVGMGLRKRWDNFNSATRIGLRLRYLDILGWLINPLTPELNLSAQRCLTRYFIEDFGS